MERDLALVCRGTIRDRSGIGLGSFPEASAGLSSISPAWSRWIAPGRIGFMSTQRRDDRCTPMAETGRWEQQSGSRFANCKDRAGTYGDRFSASPARDLPAIAAGQTAPPAMLPVFEATNSLRLDDRNQQQLIRLFSIGSPPTGQAAAPRPFFERSSGDLPLPSPVLRACSHPTLPPVPVALSCRTERYDGKGNLYLQHAA